MLLGIMSDTHDNVQLTIRAIRELLNVGVDEIVHLGDIVSPFTLKFIEREVSSGGARVRVTAVLGNNDGDVYALNRLFSEFGWRLLPSPSVVEFSERKFYLMHGFGGAELTEELARIALSKVDVSGVLYGHTHKLNVELVGDKILLNPGEVCGYLTGRSTAVVLNTEDLLAKAIELHRGA